MNYCQYGEKNKCAVCGHVAPVSGLVRQCGLSAAWASEKHSPPPAAIPDLTRTDAPSFLTKVKNFASAAVSHVAAGMPMASDEEIIRRHDICLGCEHLKDNACELCGCPISREFGYVSKLSWADQKCPAGKW